MGELSEQNRALIYSLFGQYAWQPENGSGVLLLSATKSEINALLDTARSEAQPSGYDGSKSLGERLCEAVAGAGFLVPVAYQNLGAEGQARYERAALTFTASLSGGEGEGKACAGPARERRGDPSPAQPADALRPGEPEDHLSQLSRIFGRKVTRFKVPGRVDGIQRMEVGFADGDSITTTGADVDSAWRALLAEAETATPDPSNTQAQKMEEG